MTARGRADLLIEQRVQCARRLRRSSGPAPSVGLASGAIFLN
jgi:hypothetical protein